MTPSNTASSTRRRSRSAPAGGSLDTTYSFPDNTWHHVATIGDGKSIKNYFDGVFVNQTTATASNYGSSTYNVHVGGGGAFDATGNHFTGEIDEVAIFNKAISADRIAAHFKAGKEGGESPVTAAIKTIKYQGGNVVITYDGILQAPRPSPARGPTWLALPPAATRRTARPPVGRSSTSARRASKTALRPVIHETGRKPGLFFLRPPDRHVRCRHP